MAFWNVSRGTFGYTHVAREIVEMDADVVTMVEAVKSATNTDFWEESCPGYRAYRLGSGMMLLVRGRIHGVEKVRAARVGRWRIADVETRGKRFSVAVCDVTSHPMLFRKPVFDALAKMFASRSGEPLILAGDFNTPPDSVHYVGIRQHANNAFESAGEGFRETWPVVFPVLTLDQVWGNHKIEWLRCRHLWTARSDHRPVVAEFEIKP